MRDLKTLQTPLPVVAQEIIESKILELRERKVMFDRDLARLYGVTTGNLNKAVSRNLERFPEDFMFELSPDEFKNLIFHFGTSSWGGVRKAPKVFTEQGVAMLSSVLKSKRAIQVNIQIMRVFTKLRQLLVTHADLRKKIEQLENKYQDHDQLFKEVFFAIKKLTEPPAAKKPKKEIGFHAGMNS